MANNTIFRHLRRAALAGSTDEELLTRYVATGDEEAFEAIVRLHGAMVFGVCRRLLRDPNDAHDAFQATFLVLVRKAASVSPASMLPNWLHGVARQTAARARCAAARRRLREHQVEDFPEPAAPPDSPDDLRQVLDEELSRLPAKNRAAVVSCDLEGRTHQEAARSLGWPVGTLASRLSRGRRMLAKRLGRRGLDPAPAAVPASLVASTVRAGCLRGTDQAAVAALTEGVLNAMLLKKVKAAVAVVLAAGMVALGGGLLGRGGAAEGSPGAKGAPEPAPAPVAKPKDKPATGQSKIEISCDGKRVEVRARFADEQLLATADKVNFDSGKDQLILEGNVKVRVQDGQGGRTKHMEGEKVVIRAGTGEVTIQGQGVLSIQGGAGVRLPVPLLGPAPLSLDFGFPVGREREVFNFYLGFMQ